MEQEASQQSAALEKPEDAGKGEAGEIARWLLEIDLQDKQERRWREKGNEAIKRYRDEEDRKTWRYNILWSNTEVLRPHLYSNPPKADVRQRFRDKDVVGNAAAEVMERALDYSVDTYDFDGVMSNAILDYILPGRAVARVRFEPTIIEQIGPDGIPYQSMSYARTYCERWPWERFRRGPGVTWDEVPWVAYEHHLRRTDIDKQFPGLGEMVEYDIVMSGVDEKKCAEEPSVFKRVRVWEIWDKEKREILYLAPSLSTQFLKREPDKYNLEGFFDCPRPLYSIESGTTLVPQVEYEMYADQAKELDRVTMRISKIANSLKLRGIYDATVAEMKEVIRAEDNQMIPTSTGGQAMAAGGLDKAVWMMPVAEAAQVLQQLVAHREQIKMTIYEIMGIGDIMRGMSDPNETLGAQQLKAQTGSLRMQRRHRDVQRFIREIMRKKAEIIAENYTPEILSLMTGIKLPTGEQKAQATAAIQQMQAMPPQIGPDGSPLPPQSPPPELVEMASQPSWDEVMQVLRSDLLRSYRIDIETDSTIAVDQGAERQQVTELITGIGGFIQSMAPAVQSGLISTEAARKVLASTLRRFKFGRQVEEMLEDEGEKQSQQQGPSPEMLAQQADMELKKREAAQRLEIDRAKLDLEERKFQLAVESAALKQLRSSTT